MSYLQVKRHLDEQIKLLNTPLRLDDELRGFASRHNVSEAQIRSVLFKCNLLIKRNNRSRFNKQAVHQIAQQVVTAEHARMLQVHDALASVGRLSRPVGMGLFGESGTLDSRVALLNQFVDVLPESRHLFAVYDREGQHDEASDDEGRDQESKNMDDAENPADAEAGGTVLNDDEKNEQDEPVKKSPPPNAVAPGTSNVQLGEPSSRRCSQAVRAEIDSQVGTSRQKRIALEQQYIELRSSLQRVNEELVYKMQKLEYLQTLSRKLQIFTASPPVHSSTGLHERDPGRDKPQTSPSPPGAIGHHTNAVPLPQNHATELRAQVNRFGVLVEKLDYALSEPANKAT